MNNPEFAKPLSVLIADDELVVLKMLSDKFARAGFTVWSVTDGQTALELVRAQKSHLIVLDWMMPGMDGLAACRAIKDDERLMATPVIILTARGEDADVARARGAKADMVVVKPISLREFLERARQLITAVEARTESVTGRGL